MSELRFIMGAAGAGKSHACLSAMCDTIAADPLAVSSPIFLLVPETVTYAFERELAEFMGTEHGEGFMRAEVFGFQRFAQRVIEASGRGRVPRVTELGKRLMLQKILRRHEKSNDFTADFARAASKRGFTKLVSDIISELKSYRVTTSALTEAMGEIDDYSPLRRKLHDIAMVYDELADEVEASPAMRLGHARMAEDIMSDAADFLESDAGKSYLKDAEIYIDGFLFFNAQEKRFLRAFLMSAKSLTVTLSMNSLKKDEKLFFRSIETKKELEEIAGEAGAEIFETYLTDEKDAGASSRGNELLTFENRLFSVGKINDINSKNISVTEKFSENIRIVKAPTRQREVESVADDIRRLCRDEGYRYRDITVLVSDDLSYGDMIKRIFDARKIPYFSTHKITAAHHPLAELLRDAVETVRSGWKSEPLFAMLKTGLIHDERLTRERVDALENYALAFGIDGKKKWLVDEKVQDSEAAETSAQTDESDGEAKIGWTYTDKFNGPTADELVKINESREAVVQLLSSFASSLASEHSATGKARALYRLIDSLDVRRTMYETAVRLKADGRLSEAASERRVWAGVMELLSQIATVFGDEAMTMDELSSMMTEGLETIALGEIPPGQDAVTVTGFDESSRGNLSAVYIIGADMSAMPRRSPEGRLLTDSDREVLRRCGIELPGGSWDLARLEPFRLYRGFTLARDYLWVSYAASDAEGGTILPSPIYDRIKNIDGIDEMAIPIENNVTINSSLDSETAPTLSHDTAISLYAEDGALTGSVTAFECYEKCPFQYFARYGMKLAERQIYEYNSGDAGSLLHALMQSFGELMRRDHVKWHDIKPDMAAKWCDEIIESLIPASRYGILTRDGAYRGIRQKTKRAAHNLLAKWMALVSKSDFMPIDFEKKFTVPITKPYWNDDEEGARLNITGKIDRVDYLDGALPCYAVIDYKTGNPPTSIEDIFHGLSLQLMTYLWVVGLSARRLSQDAKPFGALYAPLHDNVISITKDEMKKARSGDDIEESGKTTRRKKMKMTGWVLDDDDIIQKFDKNGDSLPSKGYKKSADELDTITNYMELKLASIGHEILSGDIAVSPFTTKKDNACTFCEYASCCGFNRRDVTGYRLIEPIYSPENKSRRHGATDDKYVISLMAKALGKDTNDAGDGKEGE